LRPLLVAAASANCSFPTDAAHVTVPAQSPLSAPPSPQPAPPSSRKSTSAWAYALARVFEIDALTCPDCGGRLRPIAAILSDAAIVRILRHLGLPTDFPVTRPARAPPPRDLEVDLCQVDPRVEAFQGIDPLPSDETS
jgi:hypothetical protein